MSDLRNVISQLASQFANGVLEAIRGASLEDILLETSGDAAARVPARGAATRGGPPAAPAPPAPVKAAKKIGRLERRSEGDIAEVVDRIVALLEQNAKGLRAEEIRGRLGLDAKELPRPIAQALADGKISKVGEKRATTYFASAGKSIAPAVSKPVAPASPKPTVSSASKPTARARRPPRTATKPAVGSLAPKASQSGPASKKTTSSPSVARSAPKTKGLFKGATKAAPKGKKVAKIPAKAAGAHKPSPIEEAVTIVTTGVPGDISG